MKIKLMSNDKEYLVEKVGVFTPKPNDMPVKFGNWFYNYWH